MAITQRKQNVGISPNANIETYENPIQRAEERQHLHTLRSLPYAALASILVNNVYFAYRAYCLLKCQSSGTLAGWIMLGVEVGLTISPGFLKLLALSVMGQLKTQPLLRLLGDDVPTVDVLICCCGEALDIVLDTVRAACALDYPANRYRIVVLDDGNSAQVKREIEALMKPNLHYSARGVKVVVHSKAANLNHGLEYVKTLPGGPGEYLRVVDVDMIPQPQWLRALLPHILKDNTVAMTNPPQSAYNIPDGDPLRQYMFSLYVWSILSPLLESVEGAYCTGSGWIARRCAIEDLGGIPEEYMQEDIVTSIFLDPLGWKITYVPEKVQWGMKPTTYAGHIKQVCRWYKGIIATYTVVWNPRAANLTGGQKFAAVFAAYSFGIAVLAQVLSLAVMPCLLYSGYALVMAGSPSQLATLLRLSFLQFLVDWGYGFVYSKASDWGLAIWPSYYDVYHMPYHVITLLQSVLDIAQSHSPSGAASVGERETAARQSKSLARRLHVMLWDSRVWMHVAIIAAIIGGAVQSFHFAAQATEGGQSLMASLLTRSAWPPALLISMSFIDQCMIPISFAVSPPPFVPRETLLQRDPVTQIAHPTETAKDMERLRPSQTFAYLAMAYFSAVFVASFVL